MILLSLVARHSHLSGWFGLQYFRVFAEDLGMLLPFSECIHVLVVQRFKGSLHQDPPLTGGGVHGI